MLSTDDLKELEQIFMNVDSKDFIKGLLISVGAIIIFYSIFYQLY